MKRVGISETLQMLSESCVDGHGNLKNREILNVGTDSVWKRVKRNSTCSVCAVPQLVEAMCD